MKSAALFLKSKTLAGIFLVLMLLLPRTGFAATAPSITTQPQSQSVRVGSNAVFRVVASGSPTLAYRWSFNGTNLTNSAHIGGATNATLTVSNIVAGDAGIYRVVVTNSHGSATSSNATLTVLFPPGITTQPTNQTIYVGGSVTFSVVATGTAPLKYRWFFAGTPLSDNSQITGSATNVLNIANVQSANAGNYKVVVTNSYGAITSAVATLNATNRFHYVNLNNPSPAPPYTDWITAATNIQDAVDIALAGDSILVTNGIYEIGGQVVFGAMTNRLAVTKPLTVQSVNGPAATTIQGYPVMGDSAVRCVYLCSNAMFVGFRLVSGSTRTTGDADLEQSGGGAWCQNSSVVISNCEFRVCSANNNGGGAVNGTFYNCIFVTNSVVGGNGGGVEGGTLASCTFLGNSAPGFGARGGGVHNSVVNGSTFLGNNAFYGGAAESSTLTNCLISGNSAGVSGGAGNICNFYNCLITTNTSGYMAGGAAYGTSFNCTFLGNSAGNDDGGAASVNLNNCLLAGNSAGGNGGGAGFYSTLNNCTVVGNSAGGSGGGVDTATANNCVIVGNSAPAGTNYSNATLNYCDTTPLPASGTGNLTNAPVFANAGAGDFRLYPGSSGIDAGNNAYAPGSVDLNGNARIVNGTVDLGAYELQNTPFIAVQPTNHTVPFGQPSVSFSVFAIGPGTLTYQWMFNGTNIAGATNATLTLNNLQFGQAGIYSVLVMNSFGSASSSNAVLTVLDSPPIILTQPASQAVFIGNALNLSVVAIGSIPLSYQWRYNGGNIPGATNATLTVTGMNESQAGNYQVLVSNGLGTTPSSPALVQVPEMVSWGYSGSTNVPAGLTNVMQMGAGYFASWAFLPDGTAAVWSTGSAFFPATGNNNVVKACVGANFAVTLQTDGGVLFYGCNCNGEGNLPPDLTNIVAMATGGFHTVAVREDGTVAVGGANWYGMTNLPPGLSNVVSVAAGYYHSLALKSDGTVVAWGFDSNGQSDVPAGLSNVVALAGGFTASYAVKSDGTVVGWGDASAAPPGLSNVVAIDAGFYDVLALKSDGTIVNWGDAAYGENSAPAGLTNVLQIGSGLFHNTVLMGQPTPRIMQQPFNAAVFQGSRTSFLARALGRQPLRYQWQLNGTNVPGATRPNLILENIQKTNAGNYVLVVTNAFGSVTSAVAALTINTAPNITGQPQSQTVIASNTASIVVYVDGTPPLNCRWYRNGFALSDGGRISGSGTTNLVISNVQPTDALNYTVVITNSFGAVTSAVATLTVLVPPQIYSQPQSQYVAVGATTVLWSTIAVGTPPFSFQWYFNGAPLVDGGRVGGSTNYVLSITNSQPGDSGNYWVVITNIAGATTSSVAVVAVLVPPAITWQPASQTLMQGSNVTFAAAASGDAPLSYQWYFNGSALADNGQVSGSSTTNLTITNLQFTNGGNYVLVVTNLVGSDASTPAVLAVISPPSITQPPADQNVLLGSNAVFSATVTGTQPVNYQWFFNNAPLTDDSRISGSTTASLTVGNSQTNDAGGYFIVATNAYGAATSAVANLTVWLPVTITQQPSNQTMAVGSIFALTVAADGSGPLGYCWYFNSAPLSDNSRISGSATGSLSISNAQTTDTGNYIVVVTNLLTAATSSVATVTVLTPPSITIQPLGRSTPLGLTNIFAAAASSGTPLSYQWRLNGADIPGATNTSYFIAAVGTNDLGAYQFAASNAVGVAVSSNAWLTVGPVAAWGYNFFNQCLVPPGLSNVTTIAGGYYYSLASRLDGSIAAWGSASGVTNSSWTNVIAISATSGGALALRADGTVVGSGSVNPLSYKAYPSNAVAVAAGYSHGLALRAEGTVIAWGSANLGGPGFSAAVAPPGLAHVTAISAGYSHSLALKQDGTVVAWGYGAATNVPIGLSNVVAIAAGQTHSLALKSDGTLVTWGTGAATNIPAGLSNVMAIAAGGYSDQRSSISIAVRSNGTVVAWGVTAFSSQTNVPTGLTNVVAVADGSYHCLALVNDGTPQILRQPAGGTAWSGRDWTLQVAAAGAAPLNYQWLLNGTNLDGATNSTLPLPAIQTNSTGNYQVVVSNPLGVATSLAAPVTVMDSAPFLLTQPATNLPVYLGSKLTMATAVGGSGPLQYQWRFNGQDIPGAAADTLNFDRIHMTNAGNYTLVVSNSFGAITSAVINLAVRQLAVWGDNSYGQTNMPPGLTNVAAISANFYNNIVLRSDGTLTVWGNLNGIYVPTNSVAGISNVVEVSAGYNNELVLKSNGKPFMWGQGVSSSLTNVVAAQSNIVAVAATSSSSSCALLRADGMLLQVFTSGVSTNSGVTNGIALETCDDGYLVLRADGRIYSYAGGLGGQSLSTTTNVLAMAAGRYQGLAVKRDGKVVDFAQTWPAVTNLSGIIGVASTFSGPEFAVRSDGSIAWGGNIPNAATNVPYGLSSVRVLYAGYNHCLALLSDRDFPPVFLHAALNTTNFVVSSKGSPQWFGQTNISHDGISAAQSASIGNNLSSSMRQWVVGPITVGFWWKVSSETNHDFLSFSAGGVVLTNISGEVDWQQCTVSVPPGNQILQWTYSKDNSGSAGQDAGWVDQLQLIPQPPSILVQPANQTVLGPTNVTFTVGAIGTPPLVYRWWKNGVPWQLPTGNPSVILANAVRADSGTYSVVVTNVAGKVTSSNMVLIVHVPQLLGTPVLQPDGSILLSSTDVGGGQLSSADLANLQVQASTNLMDWVALPGALTLSNGVVQLQDSGSTNSPARFYRIIESW